MTLTDWIESFAENLSELMERNGMSQRKLSEKSGVSLGMINSYVNKQSYPGARAIINIAYALDVSTDELIDFGDTID